jgi:hypothetical protein
MADPRGDKLYVNLSSSQARKRLKGFGHGVRKVQSVGKNQAAIIHTATGRHLDELQAVFADVGYSNYHEELSDSVESLRNLGPTSANWLREVGITSIAGLARLGPAVAYQLVRQKQPNVSLNLLWAMAAGLANRDWRELSQREKQKLLSEVEED